MISRYCWHCRRHVPMLDSAEAAVFSELRPGADVGVPERKVAFFAERERIFEALVGTREGWPKVGCSIDNHIAGLYGPDCIGCGIPLRTRAASYCAACGLARKAGP